MLLLLLGQLSENVTVLGIGLPGFILGKTPHLSAVTPPQYDLGRIVGNGGGRNQSLSAGDQCIDSFQTGDVRLFL